jgi:pimeloyl-ACP methyl ester carboxylesterase
VRPLNLVLLRGLARESGHWLGFRESLAAAFPGSSVLLIDLAGTGARHRDPTPLSIGELVAIARRDFLEAIARPPLAGRPAAIFAVSLGGMVTLEWLRRFPGDFARAAIGNSSLRGLSPLHHRLRPAAWPGMLKAATLQEPLLRERRILSLISNRAERHEEVARRWAEIGRARPVSLGSFARQLLAAARYTAPAEPPPVPVLVLRGAGDRLVDPSCSEAISRAWSLPLATHPAAGHDLALDAEEWLLEQLTAWFGTIRGEGSSTA